MIHSDRMIGDDFQSVRELRNHIGAEVFGMARDDCIKFGTGGG